MRPNELWIRPHNRRSHPGQKPFRMVVNVVVVGPFKEEEKGIGIASDMIT